MFSSQLYNVTSDSGFNHQPWKTSRPSDLILRYFSQVKFTEPLALKQESDTSLLSLHNTVGYEDADQNILLTNQAFYDSCIYCNNTNNICHAFNLTFLNCTNYNHTESVTRFEYKHFLLGFLLALCAVVTIVGNTLVMIAVARERYLRTVTNYFIVSLALADLIIGALVMPFAVSNEVTNQFWFFGHDWCDVWHSFDVLASTASILNLSVISLDRYWAITDPIAYPCKMSTGKALVLIALVWICSAAISFPAILWWRAVSSKSSKPHFCAFTEDPAYLILSSIISFYVPVFIILFAYYRIYKAASKQMRSLKAGSKVMSADGVNGEVMTLRIHRGGQSREDIQYARTADSDSDTVSPSHTLHNQEEETTFSSIPASRRISSKWSHFAWSRKISKVVKEQKAAKTLGIVMGVFCICWVPFFVTNVLFGMCNLSCVPHADVVFPVFTWLGYINSGMNPVIYACSMRDFRRAFSRILFCFCPRHRHTYKPNPYDSTMSSTSITMSSMDRYQVTHTLRL